MPPTSSTWRISGGGGLRGLQPPPPKFRDDVGYYIPITYRPTASLPHSHSRVVGVAQWLAPPPPKKKFWIRHCIGLPVYTCVFPPRLPLLDPPRRLPSYLKGGSSIGGGSGGGQGGTAPNNFIGGAWPPNNPMALVYFYVILLLLIPRSVFVFI